MFGSIFPSFLIVQSENMRQEETGRTVKSVCDLSFIDTISHIPFHPCLIYDVNSDFPCLNQGCTNRGRQGVLATKCFTVVPDICGS